jgi:hypothetical protein
MDVTGPTATPAAATPAAPGAPAEPAQEPDKREPQADPAPEPAKKPVLELGGKTFESAEQLLDHAKELQGRLEAQQQPVQAPQATVESVTQEIQEEGKPVEGDPSDADIETLFLTNPKRAKALIASEVKQEILGEIQKKEDSKAFWDEFYQENPSLSQFRDVVELAHRQHFEELKPMKLAEGKLRLAQLSESFLNRVKDGLNTQRVESGKVEALESSGATVPKTTQAPAAPVARSFVDQLSAVQNKIPRR